MTNLSLFLTAKASTCKCRRQLSLGDNPDAEDNTLSELDCGEEALLNSTLRQRLVRAVLSLAGGVLLCAVFSEPLVNAVTSSSRVGTPPRYFDLVDDSGVVLLSDMYHM